MMPALLALAVSRVRRDGARRRSSGRRRVFLDLVVRVRAGDPRRDRGRDGLRRRVLVLGAVVGRRGAASCSWPGGRPGRPADRGREPLGSDRMTIERVFVGGAGLMGHGIAQVHAAIGKQRGPLRAGARPGRGRSRPDRRQPRAGGREGPPRRERRATRRWRASRRPPTSADAADADLVVEAVFEDLDVKRRLWADLDGDRAGRRDLRLEHQLDLDRHARRARSARRAAARFVGMHFFSPVPVMPLVELIRGTATTDATEATPSAPSPPSSASRSSSRPTGRASSSTGS